MSDIKYVVAREDKLQEWLDDDRASRSCFLSGILSCFGVAEHVVVNENQKLKQENEKLKNSIDECLAIIAHIDPELYSASDAIRMISKELLKHVKQ